jgi:trans-2,3-dihydro-3-hydroxyanthranilate isomerase
LKINYLLLDVFTTERLKGNPLAVVQKADALLDNQMQAIANEFNLSETVFIMKPKSEKHTASVRIFTPVAELPFAGHPTVGAAVVLGLQVKLQAVRIEEKIGVVTCLIEHAAKNTASVRFGLPRLPESVGPLSDRTATALALGIDLEDIGCGVYHPGIYSAGVIYHLVPVRSAEVLARIQPNPGHWNKAFPMGDHSVYVFSETPEDKQHDFAARMFWVNRGLTEDPGTGSAAAALIGLISQHAGYADGQSEYALRQGVEMGRPCTITMQIRKENDVLTHAGIGGAAIVVGEGSLDLGD